MRNFGLDANSIFWNVYCVFSYYSQFRRSDMVCPSPRPVMKPTLTHRNHAPSTPLAGMVRRELKSPPPALQIDEARVHLKRRLTDSPSFKAS